MYFGPRPPLDAAGCVLAHRLRVGDLVLPKGHRLSSSDCEAVHAAGNCQVTVACLDAEDVGEDEAARQLGSALSLPGIRAAEAFTGRVNLFAQSAGVLVVDPEQVEAFNSIDEGMTLATLAPFRRVVADEMIGTVKIIPFALPVSVVRAGLETLDGKALLALKPFLTKRVGLVMLALAETKASVIAKTERVTRKRVETLGGSLVPLGTLVQDFAVLSAHLAGLDLSSCDILLIFGAAAITDRRDVIPRALEAVGGELIHLGMPVDPGNLLLLAQWRGKPVIGAPGCARSPAENGFDWVLERLVADIPVAARDIRAMGAGGLLMEIVSRPQPRGGKTGESA
ncbi:MoeA_like domain containing protein [Rhabdaerophilaceae bacterium]